MEPNLPSLWVSDLLPAAAVALAGASVLVLLGSFLLRRFRQSGVRWAAGGGVLLGLSLRVAAALADGPDIADVGEPFDVKAFEAYSLPAGKNADSLYALAQRSLVKLDYSTGRYTQNEATQKSARQAAVAGWGKANPDARKWLNANEKALAAWKAGTTRAEGIEVPLSECGCESLLPVSNDARIFAALALLKASHLASEGHAAEAWNWYRATLRFSRHLGMYGGIVERMVGADVYRLARDPIVNWSARPDVTAAELRQALADVVVVDTMTAPVSRTLKIEYLTVRHSIVLVLSNLRKEHPFVAVATRQSGRPEQMVRVANLWFSNWLANAERPRWQRKPMSDKQVGLFEPDASSPKLPPAGELKKLVAMQLTGLEANMGMVKDPMVDYALPRMMSLFDTVDQDRVNRAAVTVALALELYFREHGRFPAALAELVNAGYLKSIPPDPFGKGEPIHYRLAGNSTDRAVLWSVGVDGGNQAGGLPTARTDSRFSPDTVFEIKAVRNSQDRK
jgi:hypothetical protein